MRMTRQPRDAVPQPYCRNSPISSEDQSIGSTELIRNRGSAGPLQNRRHQLFKPRHGRKIAPPAPKVDARKHQFLPARLDKLLHRTKALVQRQPNGSAPESPE